MSETSGTATPHHALVSSKPTSLVVTARSLIHSLMILIIVIGLMRRVVVSVSLSVPEGIVILPFAKVVVVEVLASLVELVVELLGFPEVL